MQAEIVVPRYVVLTRMADSWIPRASHGDAERAEAEAFRWRRIYGPTRTRIAEYLIPEPNAATIRPEPAVIDIPVATPLRQTAPAAPCNCWYEAGVRALALYLGFGFANRAMELLILLATP